MSFGFKYGLPSDTDLVFCVPFCPILPTNLNLYQSNWLDKDVFDYVMNVPSRKNFTGTLGLIEPILPGSEGRKSLS